MGKIAYISLTVLETIYPEDVSNDETLEDYAERYASELAEEIVHATGHNVNDIEIEVLER